MTLLQRAFLVLALASCVVFAIPLGKANGGGSQPLTSVKFDMIEDEGKRETRITIEVRGAIPNHFYTVWIRLRDPDGDGPQKANPLTGTNSVPLAPIHALDDLVRVTAPEDLVPGVVLPNDHCSFDSPPSCAGTRQVINGFSTDNEGRGQLRVELDFVLSDGIYPFDEYDATPLGFLDPLPSAEIKRVADNAGGTLRVVSHLADEENPDLGVSLGHGLVPGDHELACDFVLP